MWEYLIRYFDDDAKPNRFQLDALGRQRWELVAIYATNGRADHWCYTFKRPLECV